MAAINSKYNPVIKKDDPVISMQIPTDILRDLVARSGESGHTIETEIAIRLARTLERDIKMIKSDNDLCLKAYEVIKNKSDFLH